MPLIVKNFCVPSSTDWWLLSKLVSDMFIISLALSTNLIRYLFSKDRLICDILSICAWWWDRYASGKIAAFIANQIINFRQRNRHSFFQIVLNWRQYIRHQPHLVIVEAYARKRLSIFATIEHWVFQS